MGKDELNQIYQKYYKDVLLYAFSQCRDWYLAEEITSDTFFKAFLSLECADGTVKMWLFRVCKNCLIDYWRKQRRRDVRSLQEISELQADVRSPLENILKEEEHRRLFRVIMTLPSRYQEVLILFYFEGLNGAEIARLLGMSPGAIRTTLHRARHEIKERLEEE